MSGHSERVEAVAPIIHRMVLDCSEDEARAAAAAKAPTAAPVPKKAAPSKRASSRRKRAKPLPAPVSEVLPQRTPVAGEPRFKLGSKWECFSCGAKFYDLNKPEPLCPKCGAKMLPAN